MSEALHGVGDLALEVGQFEVVVVDNADGADAGGGEVHDERATQSPGADNHYPGLFQSRLPNAPHFLQQNMARIPADLILGEIQFLSRSRSADKSFLLLFFKKEDSYLCCAFLQAAAL